MATRKSGDGSRGMSDNSDRPGSYAKVSGSRRKRKGKRGKSLVPSAPSGSSVPPASVEQPIEADLQGALDAEGEEVERHEVGRPTMPEWGANGAHGADHARANDDLVDDLRRKPSSNRALRNQVGPLGMEDARTTTSSQPARISTPRPSSPQRLNVVEVDATEQAADNSNHDRGEQRHDRDARHEREQRRARGYEEEPANGPFGDPFADEDDTSGDDEEGFGRTPYGQQHEHFTATPSTRAGRGMTLQRDAYGDEDELHARPSLSSVFGARPSLRPSPPPPVSKGVSALWWVVVSALSAIIVAAGVIAVREAQKPQQAARASAGPEVASTLTPTPVPPPALKVADAPASTSPRSAETPPSKPAPFAASSTAKAAPGAPLVGARPMPGLLARPGLGRPADAGIARTFARPVVRPHAAAPAARPVAAPAPSGESEPTEHLPQNPYN